MANRNRTAGNGFERTIVNELKLLGYKDISTTRAESRNLDNKGIDIMGEIPFYVQCKYSQNNPNYVKLLKSPLLPTDRPTIVIHRKCKKSNVRFVTEGDFVILTKEHFYNLLKT